MIGNGWKRYKAGVVRRQAVFYACLKFKRYSANIKQTRHKITFKFRESVIAQQDVKEVGKLEKQCRRTSQLMQDEVSFQVSFQVASAV